MQNWPKAVEDADKCITIKPDWGKGYGRKGAALHGMGDLEGAHKAYKAGLAVEPGVLSCLTTPSNQTCLNVSWRCELNAHTGVRRMPVHPDVFAHIAVCERREDESCPALSLLEWAHTRAHDFVVLSASPSSRVAYCVQV